MFCGIMKAELNVPTCPVQCIYRNVALACGYDSLNKESGVTAVEISEIKGVKLYKVKADSNSAKAAIEIGLIVDRYAEFIKDSYPDDVINKAYEGEKTVSKVLRRIFKLSVDQQDKFWDRERFEQWSGRNNVTITLSDVSQTFLSISLLSLGDVNE